MHKVIWMKSNIFYIVLSQLSYDPSSPMLFTNISFWLFFLIVLLGYSIIYKNLALRNGYLLFVSLFFYYKCSGIFVWLLVISIITNYFIGIGIAHSSKKFIRKLYVVLGIILCIALLSYFKYTGFFIECWNRIFNTNYSVINYIAIWANQIDKTSHFDINTIILPVGISFYTFQALSYLIDLYRYRTKPAKNIIDFGFYKSFFPQIVSGPIVRAAEFIPQIYKGYAITNREMGHALFLIINGLIKKMIISDYLSLNFVDRIFDSPLSYSGFENLLGVYGYAIQIYCDFSGYTDIAIGIALLLGFRIPINFNSPYKAADLTDFWRRWHISLSSWLRDYLYIPLGGNRKGKIITNLNLLITMLIGGLWHGANIRFLIWGALHGIGLIINKLWQKIFGNKKSVRRLRKFIYQFLTFQFVTFAWIFFRSQNLPNAFQIINQIVHHFQFQLIPDIIQSYPAIITVLFAGFVMHWLPYSIKEKYRGWFIKTPIYVKAIITIMAVILIVQVKSSVLQPFIYFQF